MKKPTRFIRRPRFVERSLVAHDVLQDGVVVAAARTPWQLGDVTGRATRERDVYGRVGPICAANRKRGFYDRVYIAMKELSYIWKSNSFHLDESLHSDEGNYF